MLANKIRDIRTHKETHDTYFCRTSDDDGGVLLGGKPPMVNIKSVKVGDTLDEDWAAARAR